MVSNIFSFHPYLGEMIQFDRYFSDGLVQPPTRKCFFFFGVGDFQFPRSPRCWQADVMSTGFTLREITPQEWFKEQGVTWAVTSWRICFLVHIGDAKLPKYKGLLYSNSPKIKISGCWFQTFFVSTPTWGNGPTWSICFKWVETA